MSRSVAVVVAVVVWLGLFAGGAFASSVFLCVPSTAGGSVTSDGSGSGACASTSTKVALPASSADQQTLVSILPHISFSSSGVGGKPTITFSGVNVQVVSGSGTTNGAVNGLGNLVLGYDENPAGRAQTGSHDLILGQRQSFTGYGELVGGYNDAVTGAYATVLGVNSTASGSYSSVTGGDANAASATGTSVSGGLHNKATASYSSIGGGCSNLAGTGTVSVSSSCTNTSTYPHSFASITGGTGNQATGNDASVSGGSGNTVAGPESAISGGQENFANGNYASVAGGFNNSAPGLWSAVLGGEENTTYGSYTSVTSGRGNAAYESYASVTGGCANAAGAQGSFDPVGTCPAGSTQSITGGQNIVATGDFATAGASPLETVISNGCGSAYIGSDSTGTSSPTSDRCDVAFGDHNLTHCRSVVQPRPSLGYLTTTSSMTSTAPGELIGITYGSQPNNTVVVTGRHSDGSNIPASQMGEFRLEVLC
jgi:hypothetical protein